MTWVAILMGSDSDWPVMSAAQQTLGDLGIETEVRVTSAHRTLEDTLSYVEDAQSRHCGAFICGASLAAHLAGVVASQTLRPVIGVPIDQGPVDAGDVLVSKVQMPVGMPVATTSGGKVGAKNAGYLAAQILAVADEALAERLRADRATRAAKVKKQNTKLQATLNE